MSGRGVGPKQPDGRGFDSRQALHPLTHYVIVRADLPRGVLAAQLVHAAGESSTGTLPPDTTAVALGVAGEDELLALEQRLVAARVSHRAIREPDPPWCGALMAIGLVPVADRASVRAHLRALKLLR